MGKRRSPYKIPRFLWFLFVSGPPLLYHSVCDYWQQRQLRKQQELQQQEESEEEVEVVQRAPRKRKTFVLPELKDDPSAEVNHSLNHTKPSTPTVISGGLWTDDDLLELAKLVKKYPVGTTERWDKIGEAMNRPPSEVAHMAHKLKDDVLRNMGQRGEKEGDGSGDEEDNERMVEEPKKVKTRGGKIGEVGENSGGNWSQVQQKALEAALAKFPKGAANDRWVKIAKCVPGKTKEECMIRYKYLVDMVKKKKEQDEAEMNGETGQNNSEGNTSSTESEQITSRSVLNVLSSFFNNVKWTGRFLGFHDYGPQKPKKFKVFRTAGRKSGQWWVNIYTIML
ncbi:DnaJ sub C member 1 [Homalodisca vitripennis]|nr:DnaJ sub C member 1 [Homalodisca vitripennis]